MNKSERIVLIDQLKARNAQLAIELEARREVNAAYHADALVTKMAAKAAQDLINESFDPNFDSGGRSRRPVSSHEETIPAQPAQLDDDLISKLLDTIADVAGEEFGKRMAAEIAKLRTEIGELPAQVTVLEGHRARLGRAAADRQQQG